MNYDFVAVNVKTCDIYDFLADGETKDSLLKRAENYKKKEIETYTRLVSQYPDRDDFKKQLKRWKDAEYKVLSYNDFKALERKKYISGKPKKTTKKQWDYALNVLPPLKWCTRDGVDMFCMSEMYTGTYTTQYARVGDNYYTKMVDCMDESTWIHNFLQTKGTKKDLKGKFSLVYRGKTTLVVGFVGDVNAFCISEEDVNYVASFYRLSKFRSVESLKTYRCRNSSNYNSFLRFRF